jgi:uncharacterized protein YcbK (DUF882 family)
MKLTKNFDSTELDCVCCGKCDMDPVFMACLQGLRDEFGQAITVTSGFRCEAHNKEIGGAAKSQHLYGKAADITHPWLEALHEMAKKHFPNAIKGPGFIHIDIGPKRSWVYKGANYAN